MLNVYCTRSSCASFHKHHGLDLNPTEVNRSLTADLVGFGMGPLTTCWIVIFDYVFYLDLVSRSLVSVGTVFFQRAGQIVTEIVAL